MSRKSCSSFKSYFWKTNIFDEFLPFKLVRYKDSMIYLAIDKVDKKTLLHAS